MTMLKCYNEIFNQNSELMLYRISYILNYQNCVTRDEIIFIQWNEMEDTDEYFVIKMKFQNNLDSQF